MQLHLKRLEHPYLHELFKAVILYDAPKVKKILAREIGGKLMKEWELDKAYQEIAPASKWEKYNGNIDILWSLLKTKFYEKERIDKRVILHEIKTGAYDVVEVIMKYRKSHYSPTGDYKGQGFRATTRDAPLYIWAWKKYHDSAEIPLETTKLHIGEYIDDENILHSFDKDFNAEILIKRGGVRRLPLDWLLPILEERMSEFLE